MCIEKWGIELRISISATQYWSCLPIVISHCPSEIMDKGCPLIDGGEGFAHFNQTPLWIGIRSEITVQISEEL